ncbi:hypothetical protein BKA65DRAFT_575160, partial [Rhexocercosporidium sp. MPI-PUGE-AT-0058]
LTDIGVFQEFYQSDYLREYHASTISWIPSPNIFHVCMGRSTALQPLSLLIHFKRPIVGKLHNRYGSRYLIFVGMLLHVFRLMMASISTEYYQIMLSQGVCSAIG